jgi:hypothetical protein
MKAILFVLLLLTTKNIFSQAEISTYTDKRLPPELVTAIDKITPENMERFVKRGKETYSWDGDTAKVKYKVKYGDGYIAGVLNVRAGDNELQVAIKLPFQYCCDNHNPRHCSSDPDKLKQLQKEHHCLGWVRAKTEEPKE